MSVRSSKYASCTEVGALAFVASSGLLKSQHILTESKGCYATVFPLAEVMTVLRRQCDSVQSGNVTTLFFKKVSMKILSSLAAIQCPLQYEDRQSCRSFLPQEEWDKRRSEALQLYNVCSVKQLSYLIPCQCFVLVSIAERELTAWLLCVGGGADSACQVQWVCSGFLLAACGLSSCVQLLSPLFFFFAFCYCLFLLQFNKVIFSYVMQQQQRSFLDFQVLQAHDYLQYTRLMPALIICRKLTPGKTSSGLL